MVVQALANVSVASGQRTVPKPGKSLLGAMVTRQSVKLHTRRSEGCWSCSDDSEQGIDKEGVVLHTGFRLASKLKGGSNE